MLDLVIQTYNLLIDNWWMYLPIVGIGAGFGFNQSSSGFQNEQGVTPVNRNTSFDKVSPTVFQQIPQQTQNINQIDPVRLNVDQFGFLHDPRQGGFNVEGLLKNLIGRFLNRTAAAGTARGQLSPENLANFANLGAQNLGAQLAQLGQQNILTAATAPQQFELARGTSLLNPFLQAGTAFATGGGTGQGGSKSFGLSGSVSGIGGVG